MLRSKKLCQYFSNNFTFNISQSEWKPFNLIININVILITLLIISCNLKEKKWGGAILLFIMSDDLSAIWEPLYIIK